MQLLGTLFIGLIVGIIAKLLTPGRDPGGFFVTILLGIGGAFVARFIGRLIGWYGPEDSAGFLASICGAILILLIHRAITRRSGSTSR